MTDTRDKYFHVSKRGVMLALAAVGLLIAGAALASYMNANTTDTAQMQDEKPGAKKVAHKGNAPAQNQQVAQAQPKCNDHNIVGTVGGGIVGGVLGHQVGRGAGNTAATIGGTLGGAYLGNQYVPTQNVTCK